MVHWKGMLGLVRLRMLRAPISKYLTAASAGPLASSSSLWAAILAMPISSGISLVSLFIRLGARGWVVTGRLPTLHIIRRLDAQNIQRPLQLPPEEIGHPQQEHLLLPILFVNDRIQMVEVVERLRDLERVLGHVRRLSRHDGALHCRIRFRGGQQHLPEVFARKLPAQRGGR